MSRRAPRLSALADEINRDFPELVAVVVSGYSNTDRKPKGLRYITHKGKGRHGNQLEVRKRLGPGRPADMLVRPVYVHNAAEAYRSNGDVMRWIAEYRQERKT